MELIDKPSKMKLSTAAEDYFTSHPNAMTVGIMSKEGREFWYRRDPRTGKPVKTTRQEALKL
jgi:hypothetical protein